MLTEEIQYTIVKRPVRRARLEYTRTGLRVIVPISRNIDVAAFVAQFESWIKKKREFYNGLREQAAGLSLAAHSDKALLERVKYFVAEAELALNVTAVEVRLRAMKRQWGNCSSKGRLTFNKRLGKLPDHLIRYIAYHEVCHLRSLRHGKLFRKIMMKFFPQIKSYEKELTVYGFRLGLEE
jgi:predicted metal-dependent hydrolase